MKNKIRTAVIGVGNMGKNHVRIYSEISNLTAVSDVNSSIGISIAKKYKVKFYENYLEMLDKEKIDAISVVVPTKFHKEVVIQCLERKIPTLVEKPIAETFPDAQLMLKESIKQKIFLMVGHVERFNPAVLRLKKMINQGKFGKIISLLPIRVGISPPVTANSDVCLDLGIHEVDIFNYILGEYPVSKKIIKHKIYKKNISDSASILLEYSNATGIIQTNWITPIKMRKLFVTGVKGFAQLDYISQKLIIYDKSVNFKTNGSYLEFMSLADNPKKEIYISKKEPLKNELEYFLSNYKMSYCDIHLRNNIRAFKILV
jgi:UDP-N-acetylglucosamine 3-dehydrogenase